MAIQPLECALNEKGKSGPITHLVEFPNYNLTNDEIRLYEKLSPLPQPPREQRQAAAPVTSEVSDEGSEPDCSPTAVTAAIMRGLGQF